MYLLSIRTLKDKRMIKLCFFKLYKSMVLLNIAFKATTRESNTVKRLYIEHFTDYVDELVLHLLN